MSFGVKLLDCVFTICMPQTTTGFVLWWYCIANVDTHCTNVDTHCTMLIHTVLMLSTGGCWLQSNWPRKNSYSVVKCSSKSGLVGYFYLQRLCRVEIYHRTNFFWERNCSHDFTCVVWYCMMYIYTFRKGDIAAFKACYHRRKNCFVRK